MSVGPAEYEMFEYGRTGGPLFWECSEGVLDIRGTDDEAVTIRPSPEPYGWMDDPATQADIWPEDSPQTVVKSP
jgi:hypothetical protein